jgi:hypothetical protein
MAQLKFTHLNLSFPSNFCTAGTDWKNRPQVLVRRDPERDKRHVRGRQEEAVRGERDPLPGRHHVQGLEEGTLDTDLVVLHFFVNLKMSTTSLPTLDLYVNYQIEYLILFG